MQKLTKYFKYSYHKYFISQSVFKILKLDELVVPLMTLKSCMIFCLALFAQCLGVNFLHLKSNIPVETLLGLCH